MQVSQLSCADSQQKKKGARKKKSDTQRTNKDITSESNELSKKVKLFINFGKSKMHDTVHTLSLVYSFVDYAPLCCNGILYITTDICYSLSLCLSLTS